MATLFFFMKSENKFKHEPKICPRCKNVFECKVGTLEQCGCSDIQLSDYVRDYIRKKFSDCLCVSCLREISMESKLIFFNSRLKD